MARDVEIDRIQAIAVSMFASALIERCQEMIVRLTSSLSFPAEVADFREEAIRHIKNAAVTGVSAAEEADAMRLACKSVEEVCDDWLKGQPGEPPTRTVN